MQSTRNAESMGHSDLRLHADLPAVPEVLGALHLSAGGSEGGDGRVHDEPAGQPGAAAGEESEAVKPWTDEYGMLSADEAIKRRGAYLAGIDVGIKAIQAEQFPLPAYGLQDEEYRRALAISLAALEGLRASAPPLPPDWRARRIEVVDRQLQQLTELRRQLVEYEAARSGENRSHPPGECDGCGPNCLGALDA